MKPVRNSGKDYLNELKRRKKESRVYKSYQLTGLIIADILEDRKHKSLYIKLAKEYGENKMIMLAKDVAERPRIKNKGAYFMRVLHKTTWSDKSDKTDGTDGMYKQNGNSNRRK